MYFINVMTNALNKSFWGTKEKYRHFESIEGVFYNTCNQFVLCSTNGFAIEKERLGHDFRMTRFVRDPRDLVVSGYFYHKRGAEPWFRMKNPTKKYWEPINGNVPAALRPNQSYAEFLNEISQEDGLMAEIEFRQFHLESLRNWEDDPRIKLFKYEDILGNEEETFDRIADHLMFSDTQKKAIRKYAQKYAFRPGKNKNRHIRDPKPSQWKKVFTPKIESHFNNEYGDLLSRYGYEV